MQFNDLTRREVLQILGCTAATTAFSPLGVLAINFNKPRITIIGGGIAGVALAWLLDPICKVTLIEKRPTLGGHADSREVQIDGENHIVDMGAQFISPLTHPNYMKLLRAINFYDPQNYGNDLMVQSKMTMTFLNDLKQNPLFVSPVFSERLWPLFKRFNTPGLASFAKFRKAARRYEAGPREDITVREWISHLPLSDYYKKNIALGLISAMNGCSLHDAESFSIREAIAFVSKSLPSNPLRSIYYFNCKKGLGGVVDELAAQCKNLTVHTSEDIQNLESTADGQRVRTNRNSIDSDFLIFACPPHASAQIVAKLPNSEKLVNNLKQFTYFHSKVALHRDPTYMHKYKKYWSIYNTRTENNYCGASIWYSRLLNTRENFFKSWVTGRYQEPRVTVYDREFLHPKINLNFLTAQRALEISQGQNKIWFAGSYTHDVDSQDTALMSAIRIAKKLAPNSPRLAYF